MKRPRIFLRLGLFAVLLISACAPAASSPTLMSIPAAATQAGIAAPATSTPVQPTVQPEATAAPTETAFPVATSRGPNLEATDPATVSLASGQLQLVEFFRFT